MFIATLIEKVEIYEESNFYFSWFYNYRSGFYDNLGMDFTRMAGGRIYIF